MHFVICVFISLMCLVTAILFTEVFQKWFKALIALIGSGTAGYAISILVRKVSIWTNAFTKPKLLPTAGIASVIVLIAVVIGLIIINKRKKA